MWLLISFSIFQTHPPHLPHKVYEMTCHSCGTVGRQPPGSMSASYEGSHPSELHLFSSHYLPATGTMREGTPPRNDSRPLSDSGVCLLAFFPAVLHRARLTGPSESRSQPGGDSEGGARGGVSEGSPPAGDGHIHAMVCSVG